VKPGEEGGHEDRRGYASRREHEACSTLASYHDLTSTLMASPGPPDSPEGVESPPRRWKRSHGVPARPLAVLLEALPVNSARHDTTRGCTGAVDQSFNAAGQYSAVARVWMGEDELTDPFK
jgi:hypothetical protein